MGTVYIVDIIIAILLLVSVLLGYRRGFVKTVFSCFSVVIALVIAALLGSHVGSFIKESDIYDDMTKDVRQELYGFFEKTMEEGIDNADELDRKLDESPAIKSLERLGVDVDALFESYKLAVSDGAGNVRSLAVKIVTQKVMSALANALGTLITFVVALIVLKLLSKLLDGVSKLPVLNSINKIAGIAAGAILGILGVFSACMALEILLPYIPENPIVYMGMEENTVLYRLFVNLNPVLLLLFA